MALRWMVTEFLTGRVVTEVAMQDPSVTLDLDQDRGSGTVLTAHLLHQDGTPNLERAALVQAYTEPGRYCLACVDMDDVAGWGGGMDRVFGEWLIREATSSTDGDGVVVSLGGILTYLGDRFLERDYHENGRASWILRDVIRTGMAGVQCTLVEETIGPTIPGDWKAGAVTYAQMLRDVVSASNVEVAVRYSLELTNGSPSRIVRTINLGTPLTNVIVGRVIELPAGGAANGIAVSRARSLDLWADTVRCNGAGSGDDQVNATRNRDQPPGFPRVTRFLSAPDAQDALQCAATAQEGINDFTGVGPLTVSVLRRNWTNKWPRLGDTHRVIVEPCLAFPAGIDALHRITRIQYQPPDAAPDTLTLTMEVFT